MSDKHLLNSTKFKFSHQVALVSKDRFIFKSLIQFAMMVILNLYITYIEIIAFMLDNTFRKCNTLQICTPGGASVDTS